MDMPRGSLLKGPKPAIPVKGESEVMYCSPIVHMFINVAVAVSEELNRIMKGCRMLAGCQLPFSANMIIYLEALSWRSFSKYEC